MRSEDSVGIARFGSFEVDFRAGELRKHGHKVQVPDQAIQVLEMLLRQPGELVTREQVQARLWPNGTVVEFDHGINSVIRRLRAALSDSAEQPRYIETLPKRGYRFIFPCDSMESPVTSSAATPSRGPRRRSMWIALGAAAFMGVLSVGIFRLQAGHTKPITSIVVLPFVNATHDGSAEYLSDGISEEIINSLSVASNLKVIARNTAFHFRNHEVDAKKIGQELNVGAVLMGTLARNGNTVIVQTDLVNAADGSELWGKRYKRDIATFQSLEADMAGEIAEGLRVRLAGDEQRRLTKQYTDNSEAYQLYLRGIYEVGACCQVGSLDTIQRSISYLQQAIAKDPNFALAHLRLASIYDSLGAWRRWPVTEAFAKGKQEADAALRIDETLGDAHAELAFALLRLDWNWPGAEREFKRAIELNASHAHARYSWYLLQIGRRQEGLTEAQRAVEIDPLSSSTLQRASFAHWMARDYDEAVDEARREASGKPSFWLAVALEQKRKYDEAIANLERLGDSPAIRGHLGHVYVMAGKIRQAQNILRELEPRALKEHVGSFEIAFIYAALGQKDLAFEWLEKAYEQHDTGMTFLKVEPGLDPLRHDPRFEQIERRVGLEP